MFLRWVLKNDLGGRRCDNSVSFRVLDRFCRGVSLLLLLDMKSKVDVESKPNSLPFGQLDTIVLVIGDDDT
jgi:hypothetical protein